MARSRTRSMKALTTLKLTSASSSAIRISRSATSTVASVRRVSPRIWRKTSWRRVDSESNMAGMDAVSPTGANVYRRGKRDLVQVERFEPPASRTLDPPQLVPELFLLRPEVTGGRDRRRNLERQPFRDRQAVAFETDELPRVVREQPHAADAQILEDLHADPVVALVGLEPEALVGLDGVEALVLQLVGADLVGQADAAPLLVEVEEHAAAFGGDPCHRGVELRAAVAPRRVEDVPGQAPRVHAHHDVLAVAEIAVDKRDVRFAVDPALEREHTEIADAGRERRRGDA